MRAFLSDEEGWIAARRLVEAYVYGSLQVIAPQLLPYEFTNAVLRAARRVRISFDEAVDIVTDFEKLAVPTVAVSQLAALPLARRYNRSAYDAAYLALAEGEGLKLITADRKLYDAVASELSWVVWLEDWPAKISLDGQEDVKR